MGLLMKKLNVKLRAIFYREGDEWAAHCLEMDILGHGETKEQALAQMTEALRIQVADSIDSGNLGNLFMPADDEIFRKYARAVG